MGLIARIIEWAFTGAERHEAAAAGNAVGGMERVEAHAATSAMRKQYDQCVEKAQQSAHKSSPQAHQSSAASSATAVPTAYATPSTLTGCKAILSKAAQGHSEGASASVNGWFPVAGSIMVVCLLLFVGRWLKGRA